MTILAFGTITDTGNVSIYIHIININKDTTNVIHKKEMFYLMTHSTHFIYGYMASDIW